MKNVAIFIRESNHTDAETSAKAQDIRVREYCEKHGYQVCDSKVVIGDTQTAFPELLDVLRFAKEKGIDTVVMTSTKRVVLKPEEGKLVQAALQESGVTIEAMDGSHVGLSNLVADFLAAVEREEDERWQEFGYDDTDEGYTVNEAEAQVTQYIFQRFNAYCDDPPADMVQSVMADYESHGAVITYEEAATKVPMTSIIERIKAEIREQWPEQFKSMVEKQLHNNMISAEKFGTVRKTETVAENVGPVISREEWDAVQSKLAEAHADGQEMKM